MMSSTPLPIVLDVPSGSCSLLRTIRNPIIKHRKQLRIYRLFLLSYLFLFVGLLEGSTNTRKVNSKAITRNVFYVNKCEGHYANTSIEYDKELTTLREEAR